MLGTLGKRGRVLDLAPHELQVYAPRQWPPNELQDAEVCNVHGAVALQAVLGLVILAVDRQARAKPGKRFRKWRWTGGPCRIGGRRYHVLAKRRPLGGRLS